ncbi:MAG TPA: hypothetical protein ENJ56_05480, partial [Anaerolineae bacterium]|nr:hypothetical protein [Anaerolineae bacterium]
RNNLRVVLHRLRKSFEPHLPEFVITTKKTVQLDSQLLTQVKSDVLDFGRLIKTSANSAESLPPLLQALSCYSGDLLAGIYLDDSEPFNEWLLIQRERLHHQNLIACEQALQLLQQQHDYEQLTHYANHLLGLEAWHEGAHRSLMWALAQRGNRQGALKQYATCCDLLANELGVDPSKETVDLFHQIKADALEKLAPVAKPKKTTTQSNLPATTTQFFGRDAELAQLSALLENPAYRLITLVGMGGIGKTRLALEAARQNIMRFPDGVWFVPLATLANTQKQLLEIQIVEAIANAVNLTLHDGIPVTDQLVKWLQSRKLLLVLDNWEHIIEGVDLVGMLLKSAEYLNILCTSQIILDFQMERIIEIEGLPVPSPNEAQATHFASIQLFTQRSEQFAKLTTADMPDVIRLCAFFAGHPLGIELAAAALQHNTVQNLLSTLVHSAQGLAVTFRDLPLRHRNIRALFDHIWVLLDEQERETMQKLAVMRGQFSEQAAIIVGQSDSERLFDLYDKSLLQRVSAEYFDLHNLTMQYMREKLAQQPALQQQSIQRHAHYYLNWLTAQRDNFIRHNNKAVKQALLNEYANIKLAWGSALDNGYATLICLSARSLTTFISAVNRLKEGARLFSHPIHIKNQTSPTAQETTAQGWLFCQHAYFLFQFGKLEIAEALFQQADEIATTVGDRQLALQVAYRMCDFLITKGDFSQSAKYLDRSEQLALALEDDVIVGFTKLYRGAILVNQREYKLALPYF